MSRNFWIAFGGGIFAIALAVAGILYMQRGSVIDMQAKILKVRTAALDENSSIAVLDFRLTNPSDLLLEVRQVEVDLVDAKGNRDTGDTISDGDAKRVFDAIPLLGPKYLESLSMRQRISAHATVDYMTSARFALPVAQLQARARFILRVVEVDGKTFEFPEK
ncbi:MAG: hypothetical protein KGN36_11480 [Acidobacteriota bacterium]|nr:hypothetical protein [Acidobacteriota bacterium]